jgi:putative DNA primase/helicase
MGSFYCKSVESSVIIKKGMKNAGQASPEIEVLDYGLRLALLSETEDGDKLNESLIKNITGYDSISYRPLYGKQKQLKAEAKLCMLTNNKPHFNLSTSMIDRLRFIDFKSRFLNDAELTKEKAYDDDNKLKEFYYKAEPELVKELKTNLKEYVLLWMVIGAKKFFNDGHLNIPDDKTMQFENLSYINELDSVQRFIDECCIVGENEKEISSNVKDHYNKFCTDETIPALKPAKLKEVLTRRFEVKKDNNNYYYGFKIKPYENDPSELDY